MDLMSFLFKDWRTRELERIDGQMRRKIFTDNRLRIAMRDRVKELEEDLGRVALLTRALVDVCLAKGLLTRDEIAAMIAKADLADGTADGKLDPKKLRPDQDRE